jgi:hypothetical protein
MADPLQEFGVPVLPLPRAFVVLYLGLQQRDYPAPMLTPLIASGTGGPTDTTGPEASNFSPAPGSAVEPTGAISFDVTDESEIRRAFVVVRYDALGRAEVAHDGIRFRDLYEGSVEPIAGGSRFVLRRRGGWIGAPTVQVFAVDAAGNEA